MKRLYFKKGYILVFSRRIVHLLGRIVSLEHALAVSFLWPFIFVDPAVRNEPVFDELIRHEAIHMYQQLELLIVGYWMLYAIEYLYALLIKKYDARKAYYYTALEQEAHRNAMNPLYLTHRKPYAVLHYIRHKKWLGRTATGELIEKDYI